MALRKTPAATTESPAFEAHDEVEVLDRQQAHPEPTVETEAVAKVQATTAIAKAQTSSIAVGSKFKAALAEYEGVISTQDLENLGIGTFPRITADLSGLVVDKTDEIGKVAKIELISWNYRYIVTPGVDNAEANAAVRYSYDNVNILGSEMTVKDYLRQLKEVDGYGKASVKTYVELWGNLAFSAGAEIDPEDRQMVQVQLSPQSVNQFKRYQLELGVKSARGVSPASNVVVITANKKELNGKKFGYMEFSSK